MQSGLQEQSFYLVEMVHKSEEEEAIILIKFSGHD